MKIQDSIFDVLIASPKGTLYEGKIHALQLTNELGPFQVVARYTNFISAIKEQIVVYTMDGTTKTYPIDVGIVKVSKNRAEIFLGIDQISEMKDTP